jgi:hypothetical protein
MLGDEIMIKVGDRVHVGGSFLDPSCRGTVCAVGWRSVQATIYTPRRTARWVSNSDILSINGVPVWWDPTVGFRPSRENDDQDLPESLADRLLNI